MDVPKAFYKKTGKIAPEVLKGIKDEYATSRPTGSAFTPFNLVLVALRTVELLEEILAELVGVRRSKHDCQKDCGNCATEDQP